MPVAACLNHYQCLARRDEVFRRDAVWSRDHECTSCIIGTARRMDSFVPEADIEPRPLRDAGKVKAPPPTCEVCGKEVSPRSKKCKTCWGLSRRINHARCSVDGCRCKARREGMCCTHYFKAKGEEKLARKKERQREATRRYREKAHAIAEYRQGIPKERIVEGNHAL